MGHIPPPLVSHWWSHVFTSSTLGNYSTRNVLRDPEEFELQMTRTGVDVNGVGGPEIAVPFLRLEIFGNKSNNTSTADTVP